MLAALAAVLMFHVGSRLPPCRCTRLAAPPVVSMFLLRVAGFALPPRVAASCAPRASRPPALFLPGTGWCASMLAARVCLSRVASGPALPACVCNILTHGTQSTRTRAAQQQIIAFTGLGLVLHLSAAAAMSARGERACNARACGLSSPLGLHEPNEASILRPGVVRPRWLAIFGHACDGPACMPFYAPPWYRARFPCVEGLPSVWLAVLGLVFVVQ